MSEIPETPNVQTPRPARATVTAAHATTRHAAEAAHATKGIEALREVYEKLAADCIVANTVGNKPEILRLRAEKQAAHTAWHDAIVAERHARRDSDKARGVTPGVK